MAFEETYVKVRSCGSFQWNSTYGDSDTFPSYERWLMLALAIMYWIYWGVTLAVFAHYRKQYHSLYKRRFNLIIFASCSGLFQSINIPIRDVVGRENYSCDAYAWGGYLVLGSGAVPIVTEVFLAVNEHIFQSKLLQLLKMGKRNNADAETTMEGQMATDDVTARSVGSANASAFEVLREHTETMTFCQSLATLPKLLLYRIHTVRPRINDTGSTGGIAPTNGDEDVISDTGSYGTITNFRRDLAFWRTSTETKTGMAVIVVVGLPFLIACMLATVSQPLYYHGCRGCEFSNDDSLAYILFIVGFGLLIIITLLRLGRFPDPLGVRRALVLCVISELIFISLSIGLTIPDVANITDSGKFHFGWISLFGLGLGHFFLCVDPVLIATGWYDRQRTRFCKKMDDNVVHVPPLSQVINNAALRTQFEKHLATEWASESLLFYDAVCNWEERYGTSPPDFVAKRAQRIYDTFVGSNASMAVNLPSAIRDPLVSYFEPDVSAIGSGAASSTSSSPQSVGRHVPSRDMFEASKSEIEELMTKGSLRRFWLQRMKMEMSGGGGGGEGANTSTAMVSSGGI